jgi:hypothetical protein
VSQFLFKILAGSAQAGFDTIQRTMHDRCNLLIAQSLDFAQGQDHAILRGEAGEDPLNEVSLFLCEGGVMGSRKNSHKLITLFLYKGLPGFSPAARFLSQEIPTVIGGDAVKPGRK